MNDCPTCEPSRVAGLERCRDCGRELGTPPPSAHHIDLPNGFYAMLCHSSGAATREWERTTRMIANASKMHELLSEIAKAGNVNTQAIARGPAAGVLSDIRFCLAQIDGIGRRH